MDDYIHFKYSDHESSWMQLFDSYVHVLSVPWTITCFCTFEFSTLLNVFVHLIHAGSERLWTQSLILIIQSLNVLELLHSSYTFICWTFLGVVRSYFTFISERLWTTTFSFCIQKLNVWRSITFHLVVQELSNYEGERSFCTCIS